jgi:hydroxymethylglutaryl-CoA lyase
MSDAAVAIVEVGPRDGFQSIGPLIPTDRKIAVVNALYAAGVRRMEATSFVSPSALPQLADADEVLAAAQALAGLDAQVLVPTARYAERASVAGAKHIAFVLSVSERHNQGNVRRSPMESVEEYRAVVGSLATGMKIRLNVATAFDCPHEGRIALADVMTLLDRLVPIEPNAEIALCDTTGRVTPDHVEVLFGAVIARYPQVRAWAFHAHDTYGLGAANVLAAWKAGVSIFDAAIAGLGGCPFAPGATGNVATEDLAWMFEGMGVRTGIDVHRLASVAEEAATIPGAQVGGRVRDALRARACRFEAVT